MTTDGHAADDGAHDDAHDDDADLRHEGERIAQLIDDLGAIGGAPVRQRTEELVRRLVHLYGAGLGHLLRVLGGDRAQRLDEAARAGIRADALLSSLLVLHGLHPDPEAAREVDPGPDPAATAPGPAAGLVQIDLGRSRAASSAKPATPEPPAQSAKSEGTP
jgi:hypothetical protein